MKKHSILFLLLIICGCFLIPSKAFAFQHGYESHSDFIYALARNELPIYYSDYSEDLKTILPKYSGVKVIGSSGSWYEVQYTSKKGSTNYGWITKEEFQSDCLIYDGREKQPFANGTYQLSFYQEGLANTTSLSADIYQEHAGSLTYTFKYVGNNCYTIQKAKEEKYLKADTLNSSSYTDTLWGEKNEAGTLQSVIQLQKEFFQKITAIF